MSGHTGFWRRSLLISSFGKFDKRGWRDHALAVTGSIMHSQQTFGRPLPRSLAAAVLMVWLLAQGLCFAHCQFGVRAMGAEKATVHSSKSASGGSCCPKSKKSTASNVCLTLKSALVDHAATEVIAPTQPVLYALTSFFDELKSEATEASQVFSRQIQSHDSRPTPEVRLGPAFRSLAPPALG